MLYKFSADWCQPCHTMAKIMKGMDYTEIDVETEYGSELARKYGVRALPTLVVVDNNGNELKSKAGIMSKQALEEWLA